MTIKVKARPGIKVPLEDNARKYITDDKAQTIASTTYYRRRISDGDLIVVADKPTTKGGK